MERAKDMEVSAKLDHPFKLDCTQCWERYGHRVKVTDCKRYTLHGSVSMMFDVLKKPLWYLKRTRVCGTCGHEFSTVEMLQEDLDKLSHSLKELYDFKSRAKIVQFQYDREKQKNQNLEHKLASCKQSLIDSEDKYKKLENYVKAAPVEHDFSCQKDEIYGENEEKEDDHLWG